MTIRAKKMFGQHFLRSTAAIDAIVRGANVTPKDIILEIGPGEGVLTKALLEQGCTVVAIEKDRDLMPILEGRFAKEIMKGKLMLMLGDISNANDRKRLFRKGNIQEGSYILAANIPYYLTGLIMRTFLDESPRPLRMVLLVQKEVGEGVVQKNGKEGILSVAVHTYGTPSLIARVPRGAFAPPPNVDSVVLLINDILNPFSSPKERDNFFLLVRNSFHTKRKALLGTLSRSYALDRTYVLTLLEKIDAHKDTRPEEIDAKKWFKLYFLIKPRTSSSRKIRIQQH